MSSVLRYAVTGLAAAATLAAVAVPANADSGQGRTAANIKASPSEEVGCAAIADPPQFLTAGGKTLWASGKIGACTTPAPDSCRLTVSLASSTLSDVAHKDGGWGSCRKSLQVPYNCHDLVSRRTYHTVVTIAVEYKGSTGSSVTSSANENSYCG